MIVDNLDRECAVHVPNETHPELIVNPDRMLTLAVAGERLKAISRWRSQIAKFGRGVEEPKFPARDLDKIGWKTLRMPAVKYGLRGFVPESPDHLECVSLNDTTVNSKRFTHSN